MEGVKETTPERENNEHVEECEKSVEQIQPVPQEEHLSQEEDNQNQEQEQSVAKTPIVVAQQQPQVQEEKELEAETVEKQPVTATPQEQQQQPQKEPAAAIDYEEEVEDDDDDDDEEKETSQKLVIDIPDEEEEEEKEEDEDDDDVIALDDLPAEVPAAAEESEIKVFPKPEVVETIITLSDGEEDMPASESSAKPGKVQKRRSMGAASATQEEEHYRLKRRKINVAGAPKIPLTGYLRYMHDRRESLRKEHPTKSAMEHTKMIVEEWHSLPSDVKATYLKAADEDKQRYVKELHSFLKSRPDILASELAKNKVRKTTATENNSSNPAATMPSTSAAAAAAAAAKPLNKEKTQTQEASKLSKENAKDKMGKDLPTASTSQQASAVEKCANEKNKRKRTPTPPIANSTNAHTTNASTSAAAVASSSSSINIVTPTPGEIPIFTNEFLEHNKIYDMELRSLRKSKTDLEQQNSVLEKHVENMKFGVEKMITENNELEEKNRLLEIYLDKLKRKLALALSALPLPTAPNGATVENIDKYMQDLYKMSTSNSHGPATLNKAKDIIRKLDLQIQL